ncbi:tyrosine-type recombinase/integrase [Clostridium manihotivorum]|uniref:Integrase n=1 Tax=Clostridium manihotivorum TaxID=2320868 RepID=A0A3R5QWV3_9CLOT|nr:site-specific integrase [Clostridium manihotivorum]QAA34095.1 integrase [Clostridium manihotivorum]
MVKMKLKNMRKESSKTVNEVYLEYLDYCITIGQRERTIDSKERFRRYELKKVVDLDNNISELKKEKIEKHVKNMITKGYKGNYYQTYVIKIRAFLTYCFNNHYLEKFEVKIPNVDLEKKIVYTEDELTKLLKKPNLKQCLIGDYKGFVTINFLLGTGCRSETLLNVRVEDIDFSTEMILFRHMKTRKQISVPLSQTLKTVLREYIQVLALSKGDLLFPKLNGEKMSYDTLHQNLSNYFMNRKVKMRGVNTFRNTFATMFIRNKGDIYRLKSILGHSNIKTTERYINMLPLDLKADMNEYNPLDVLSKQNRRIKINK